MPKSWQEIEFLDYKERQVRRRSQKTRELQQVGSGPTSDKSRLVRIFFGGLFFLTALGAGIFAYQRNLVGWTALSGNRSTLTVSSSSGDVEISSTTTGWEPLKTGAPVASATHIRTGKNGKIVLTTSIPGSRIVLYENTSLQFEKVQLSQKNPASAAFTFEMERGEAVFDFPAGEPITKVVMPFVTVWSQLVRYKARATKDENRILVTRFACQCEDRSDASKKVVVPDQQELVATLKDPVPKPRGAGGAALRERWD